VSLLAVLPVLALLVLGVAVASPAAGVIAAVPVLLFSPAVAQFPGMGPVQYADEGIVVLLAAAVGIRWLVGRAPIVSTPAFGWAAAFLGIGFLSGLVAGVPPGWLVPAAALAIKGWLFAFVVAQVDWRAPDLRRVVRASAVAIAVIVLTSLVNLAAPEAWTSVAGGAGDPVEYRWVLPSLIGPFMNPIDYGQVLSLVAGALAALTACLRDNARTLAAWATVLACLMALLSFRRLAVLAVVAGLLVVLVARRSAAAWVAIAAAVPLLVLLSAATVGRIWDATAQEYFGSHSQAARTLLTLRSFDVAGAHFPFGAGFGRYGSFLAGVDYSPEYYAAGLDEVYGLMPTPPYNTFLTDTFWPAILGESGYVGALCYLAAVAAVFLLALRVYRTASGAARTVALMTATVWVQALVLSPGGAILTSGPTAVLPFLLLGLLCRLAASARAGTASGGPAGTATVHPMFRPPGSPRRKPFLRQRLEAPWTFSTC
jgi:hypothetical protein